MQRLQRWTVDVGLVIGAALMVAGVAMHLVADNRVAPAVNLDEISRTLATEERLLAIGILVILATAVVRLILLGTGWALERDWRFTAAAGGALAILALAIYIGLR